MSKTFQEIQKNHHYSRLVIESIKVGFPLGSKFSALLRFAFEHLRLLRVKVSAK